jgi:hypothetical protein
MDSILSLPYAERERLAVEEREQPNPPSFRKLAQFYNIPRITLQDRVNGVHPKKGRPPPYSKLSELQENCLVEYCARLDAIGTSIRRSQLAMTANSILAKAHTGNGPPPTVGASWPTRFLQRHPELIIKKQKPLEIKRQVAHDIDSISSWFRRFKETYDNLGIQPEDCWNFDETGFRIGMGKAAKCLTVDPQGIRFLPNETNRDYATSVEAVNAAGREIPPMLILKAMLILARWFKTAL